jgi:hypothetical protein
VEKGPITFNGSVRTFHPRGVLLPHDGFPLEYALLVAAMCSLDMLGGDKSSGLGRCQLEIVEPIHWFKDRVSLQSITLSQILAIFKDNEWQEYISLYEEQREADR